MRVLYVLSGDGDHRDEEAAIDSGIVSSLRAGGLEVVAVSASDALRRSAPVPARTGLEALSELRREALGCDVLVTSGWTALRACERLRVVSDVHLVARFEAPVRASGRLARGGDRRLPLINRARHVLVRTVADLRLLRACGRFPSLLIADSGDLPADAPPLQALRMADLSDFVRSHLAPGRVDQSLAVALRSAAPRCIRDLAGLLDACLDGGTGRIQTVNQQHIHLARISPVFRGAIATATAITADGWPIARLLVSGGYQVERTTGADLVRSLLFDPRTDGLRIGLIGGAELAGSVFERRARDAGAAVVLREHGDKRDWDPVRLAARLNELDARLALVAVSQPAGDLLAAELLAAGYRGTAIGIGAAVELFVGGERRAAEWVQRAGLEWLFRFVQDPRRLWRRYLVEGVPTYFMVLLPMSREWRLGRVPG